MMESFGLPEGRDYSNAADVNEVADQALRLVARLRSRALRIIRNGHVSRLSSRERGRWSTRSSAQATSRQEILIWWRERK